jgi:hypothetical protein
MTMIEQGDAMTGQEVPDSLTTPACRVRFGFIPSKTGELRLGEGFVTLTINGEQVFRVPPGEVQAAFPWVTFFFILPFPRTGINLTVAGTTYWLWLVPFNSGWGWMPVGSGGSYGQTWSVAISDIKPARDRVRQWRAAFGQPS